MKKDSEKSHCSAKTMPVPMSVACGKCGDETELWSDEDEIICSACGQRILRTELLDVLSGTTFSL